MQVTTRGLCKDSQIRGYYFNIHISSFAYQEKRKDKNGEEIRNREKKKEIEKREATEKRGETEKREETDKREETEKKRRN